MDSERIREERMRKAYLALLTGFVMTGCAGGNVSTQSSTSDRMNRKTSGADAQSMQKDGLPASRKLAPEEVKYMLSPAGVGASMPTQKALSVYQAIQPGMREKDIAELLAPVLLESGVETSGAGRRTYYRIGQNTQFWVDYSGTPGNGWSGRKSELEPKRAWRRYPSGSIEIMPLADPEERIAGKGGAAGDAAAAGR